MKRRSLMLVFAVALAAGSAYCGLTATDLHAVAAGVSDTTTSWLKVSLAVIFGIGALVALLTASQTIEKGQAR